MIPHLGHDDLDGVLLTNVTGKPWSRVSAGALLGPSCARPALEAPAPGTKSDEELLRHYRATGQAADFTELVRRYAGPLRVYLTRYLGDPDLADDLVQTTFLRVLDRCGQYHDGRRVRPWLYAIANHQAIDALRHRGRHALISLDKLTADPVSLGGTRGKGGNLGRHHQGDAALQGGRVPAFHDLLPGNLPDPAAELMDQEERRWLHASVDSLPDALRRPVVLAYQGGRSYREIAATLHVPVSTVKSRLHEALNRLRAMALADHLVESR